MLLLLLQFCLTVQHASYTRCSTNFTKSTPRKPLAESVGAVLLPANKSKDVVDNRSITERSVYNMAYACGQKARAAPRRVMIMNTWYLFDNQAPSLGPVYRRVHVRE
jgi:hypothetical protein